MLYYFWLLNKKIRTKIHNLFEKKKLSKKVPSIEYVNFYLWNFIQKRITYTPKGIFYKTKVMNNNSPMTLAQARVLMGLCNLYNNGEINSNGLFLIKEFQKYILSMKQQNGIYKFNQKSWNLQDEGIATIWVLLALLETYKITKDDLLLKEIIDTINIVNKILFSKKNSLVHTLGDDYWCLNAASTYAWFVSELFEFYKTDELYENYVISVKLCNEKFSPEGYFPYSEKRLGTYLLLYNPVVMYTLQKAVDNDIVDEKLKVETEKNLSKAKNFLLKQKDKNDFFVEPEMKVFSRYIISNVIALVSLKNKIDKELEKRILDNIKSYFIDDKMFLCRNNNGEYYDGNLYEVNDVLVTEVFYWLTTYLK
jgi:hypothetical protein